MQLQQPQWQPQQQQQLRHMNVAPFLDENRNPSMYHSLSHSIRGGNTLQAAREEDDQGHALGRMACHRNGSGANDGPQE